MPSSSREGDPMINREEYVQKLKHQIEQWNAQMAQWEATSRDAKDRYMKQLEQFRDKRDAAMAELRRQQGARAGARQPGPVLHRLRAPRRGDRETGRRGNQDNARPGDEDRSYRPYPLGLRTRS